MTKRTIEIDDDLDERVESIKEEIKEHFIDYLKEHLNITDFDTYYQDSGCDIVHEIADNWTPIYYSQIDGLYYLHGNEFDEEYENAGIGHGGENNYRQVTIYCYLSGKGFEYLNELQTRFEDWLADKKDNDIIENFIIELQKGD